MTELLSKSCPLSKIVMTEHRHTQSLWVWSTKWTPGICESLQREPKTAKESEGFEWHTVTAWWGHQCVFLLWAGLRDGSLLLCVSQHRVLGGLSATGMVLIKNT